MGCIWTIRRLTQPVQESEDVRRKEYILNVILVISLIATMVLSGTLFFDHISPGDDRAGINLTMTIIIMAVYSLLLYISKKGHSRIASMIFIVFNVLGTTYIGWKQGASLPETLLLTTLVIITSSIIFGSTTGFATAGIMIVSIAILGIHEAVDLDVPDWRYDQINITNVITYAVIFLFISFIIWLSNREVDRSLRRARESERLLKYERDNLERLISERTQALVISQEKRLLDSQHAIHIGELARGILHDIMNPLSAISLYVDEMARVPGDIATTRHMLQKTIEASSRMNSLLDSAKHHIHIPCATESDEHTDIRDELRMVYDIFAHRVRATNIRLHIESGESLPVTANPIRIHQILINLISNAIDACLYKAPVGVNPVDRSIEILAKRDSNYVEISISDNGCGIPERQLKNIFTEPVSTKHQGIGIGLKSIHSIIVHELKGTITVTSTEGLGTTFIVNLPLHDPDESTPQKT